jgi:glycosyltransferase involved in cell wall biosynthesis
MKLLSVVIPVLNEENVIEVLIERVVKNVELITEDYEILLIDDGSQDKTWKIILNESLKNKNVKGFRFSRNFGHHYAISAGLHNSLGKWVIVMDGDLQDRPEVIPDLYRKAQDGFDVVFVSRQDRPESFIYLFVQKTYYFILRLLSGIEFDSTTANYSIISKKVVESFKNFPEHSRFYGSTIKWLGYPQATIKAIHGNRFAGKSSYSVKRRLQLAADVIFSFSVRPLKFAIYLGLAVTLFSIIFLTWTLSRLLFSDNVVVGWASVISFIGILGGTIITILGIIGNYIGRTYEQVKNRPLFIISESVNFERISN